MFDLSGVWLRAAIIYSLKRSYPSTCPATSKERRTQTPRPVQSSYFLVRNAGTNFLIGETVPCIYGDLIRYIWWIKIHSSCFSSEVTELVWIWNPYHTILLPVVLDKIIWLIFWSFFQDWRRPPDLFRVQRVSHNNPCQAREPHGEWNTILCCNLWLLINLPKPELEDKD